MPLARDEFVRKARVVRVIDGDTVELEIDLGWSNRMTATCRLLNVDTPEIRGPERPDGLQYKAFVIEWLAKYEYVWIQSRKYDRGKYGRCLVDIYDPSGNSSLNETLLAMLGE